VMGYLGYGVLCFALVPLPMGLFMVAGRNMEFLLIVGIGILSGGVCMAFLRGFLPPMTALAVGTDVLFWVALAGLLLRGATLLGYGRWEGVRESALTLAPLVVAGLLFALIGIALPNASEYNLTTALENGLVKGLLFLAGFAPVLVVTERQLKLIRRLRNLNLNHG